MPKGYLNENGQLCQGYFCCRCGQSTGMYGHMKQDCTPNPELVKKLYKMNAADNLPEELSDKEDKAAQERAKFDADDEYMFEKFEESNK